MSKAILIIDKPERSCIMCPCYELESGTCQALPNDDPLDHYDINDNQIILKDCPLKPYKEVIPIEWLHSIMERQIIFAMSSEMEGTTTVQDGIIHCVSGALACQVLENVIKLWEKENE